MTTVSDIKDHDGGFKRNLPANYKLLTTDLLTIDSSSTEPICHGFHDQMSLLVSSQIACSHINNSTQQIPILTYNSNLPSVNQR